MISRFSLSRRFDGRLVENLLSLYGLHALSMLLPLALWPWLGRTLGPMSTGLLAVSEAAARYVGLVVEFGYQFSATRLIAQSQSCPETRARIVRSVLAGQLILSLTVVALFPLAWLAIPALSRHADLTVAALCWGVALGLNPAWYFQGTERMRQAAGVDVACRAVGLVLVLACVRGTADAWMVPVLNGLCSTANALLCWRMVLRENRLGRLNLAEGWEGLAQASHVFLFRGVASLYTTANVLLLGMLARPEAVGFFAAAEKLAKAGVSALYPISQTMYPRIARLLETDRAAARASALGSLKTVLAIGAAIGLALAASSAMLVSLLFGPAFAPAAPVLVLLSFLGPVIAVSNVLGLQWMLPQRMERELNVILVCGASVGLLLALLLAPRFGAEGMALAVLCAEFAISAGIVFCLTITRSSPWLTTNVRQELA